MLPGHHRESTAGAPVGRTDRYGQPPASLALSLAPVPLVMPCTSCHAAHVRGRHRRSACNASGCPLGLQASCAARTEPTTTWTKWSPPTAWPLTARGARSSAASAAACCARSAWSGPAGGLQRVVAGWVAGREDAAGCAAAVDAACTSTEQLPPLIVLTRACRSGTPSCRDCSTILAYKKGGDGLPGAAAHCCGWDEQGPAAGHRPGLPCCQPACCSPLPAVGSVCRVKKHLRRK